MMVRLPESTQMPGRLGPIVNVGDIVYAYVSQDKERLTWELRVKIRAQEKVLQKTYGDEEEARDALDTFSAKLIQAVIEESPL